MHAFSTNIVLDFQWRYVLWYHCFIEFLVFHFSSFFYSLLFFLSFPVILVHAPVLVEVMLIMTPLSKKNRRPKSINLARKFSSSFQKWCWSISEKRNPSNETVWKYDLRKKVIEDEKNILVFLLFISYWIGIRHLIQILFSYCFLLIYSVFKLVQSTKAQYLSHQGEQMNFQAGPWNSEYQKFNTSVNQSYLVLL